MLNFTCAFVLPNVSALVPVHAVTMEIRCMYVCMYIRVARRWSAVALDFLPCPLSYYYAATCKVVCSLAPSCRYHLRSIRLFSRRQFLSGALYLELHVFFFHLVYQTTDWQHCYVS